VSLVALLVAFPFLEDLARPRPLLLIVPLAAVFVAGVLVADAGSRAVRGALTLAAIQVALSGLTLVQEKAATDWMAVALALAATMVLILFSTYCLLGYVLRARTITHDQIYAGVCMYVMLGFAFGTLFYLINMLDPKSFAANVELLARGDKPDLLYFSFVTLATLGYGDITPRTNIARSLAIVESLAGMLYIAIFMARLVSMRTDSDKRSG
jgi:hypothetical protein